LEFEAIKVCGHIAVNSDSFYELIIILRTAMDDDVLDKEATLYKIYLMHLKRGRIWSQLV
jgi:hypothetical protein